MQIIDITPTIEAATPVYPGDAALSIEVTGQKPALVSAFRMSAHLGAHVDAPKHLYFQHDICEIDLARLMGECFVLDLSGVDVIRANHIPDHLAVPRVLIKTGFLMPKVWTDSFAYLDKSAVEKLGALGANLIGIDTPSIDRLDDDTLAGHRVAMSNNMLVLENLVLQDVSEGIYELVALPLKIKGLEASPVRAILIKKEN